MTRSMIAQIPSNAIWMTLQLPVNFSSRWQLHNEGMYRTLGTSFRANQRFYRTGIRYRLSNRWTAAGGVSFFSTRIRADKNDNDFGKEFRLWQEMVYQHEFRKRLSLQYRLRAEERYLEATIANPASRILNLNNRLSIQKPISDKWTMVLGEELFEQVVDRRLVFNQNRLSAGGIFNVNNTLQVQGTYLWVQRKVSAQHVMQLTLRKTILLYESEPSK